MYRIGHLEAGEDEFTAAVREAREETGYTADDFIIYKDIQRIIDYGTLGRHKTVVYWPAELKDPQKVPTLSSEHIEFRWLPKDEVTSLIGYPNFIEMLTYFQETIQNP